jgi:SAM-dependent methyltransferase
MPDSTIAGSKESVLFGETMRFIKECLVCSGENFTTRMESTFSGTPIDAAQFFLANRRGVVHGQIQSCNHCGFVFTNPQFSSDEYDEIYKNAPGPSDSTVTLDEGDARRFRRLAKNVRSDVGRFGRFLDFGCGRGGFLLAMNDPMGIGFEVGEPAASSVGPSQVTTGKFLDVSGGPGFEKGSFDLITAFDVFEHLPNLDEYVEVLSGLLKPGGHLVITVPDVDSWNARLAGARWNMYLLEHLWYFNRETLKTFMKRAGFRETRHRILPYDAPLAHIVRRVAQTYGVSAPEFGPAISSVILPVPIGLMYGVFARER